MKTNLHSIRHQSFKLIATLVMLLFTNVCYAKSLDVTLTEGGTLSQFIPKEDYASITELKVSGPFNSEDIVFLKKLPNLDTLDLSNITLTKGKNNYAHYSNQWGNKLYDSYSVYTIEKGKSYKYETGTSSDFKGGKYWDYNYYVDDLRYAFEDQTFKTLYWPKSVTTIGINAFERSDIQNLYISAETDSISSKSFENANHLENVFIDANNSKYKDIDGVVYNKDNELVFRGIPVGFIVKKTDTNRSTLKLYLDTLRTSGHDLPFKLISVTCNGKSLISRGNGWEGDLWVLKGVYFKEREVIITYSEGDKIKKNIYVYPAVNPTVTTNGSSVEYTKVSFSVEADEGFSEVGAIVNDVIIGKSNSYLSHSGDFESHPFTLNNLEWNSPCNYRGYAIYEGDTIKSCISYTHTDEPIPTITTWGKNKPIIGTTSCLVNGSFSVGEQYIDSCGWEISDMKTAWGTTKWTNKLTHKFVDLVPGKTYYAYFIVDAKGRRYRSSAYEFFAPSVTFENLPTDMVSNTTARISANTNCDATHNIGFEWRKYDAPDLVPSTYSECPVINGKLSGTLNNLSANTYYKYRPYYKDTKGDYTYGDWLAFGTSDAYAYFKPDVFTSTYEQNEQSIKLTGYVIGGSDKITKQGFEYWTSKSPNKKVLESTGQYMQAEIKGLISGATYSYRAFATTSKETIYGDTFEFSVPNTTGINHAEQNTEEMQIYFNSQKGIMVSVADKANSNCSYRINNINGDIVETGKIVADENWHSVKKLLPGIYIITVSNLKESKIIKVAIK